MYEIWRDEDVESPREWDNLGTMCMKHRRYNLPLEADNPDLEGAEVLTIRGYDHGGLSCSTSTTYPYDCPWDSGVLGIIFCPKDKIIKEYGDDSAETRKKVRAVLEAEVVTFNAYLTGEFYGYTVTYSDGEIIDTCGGFDSYELAEAEAQNAIDSLV